MSRLSATGRACWESLLALNFLFCLHRIPKLLPDPADPYTHTLVFELMLQPLRTARLSGPLVGGFDLHFQPSFSLNTLRRLPSQPSVIAALGYMQDTAHHRRVDCSWNPFHAGTSVFSIVPQLKVILAQREWARPNWQNNMATNWPQHVNPLA